MTESDKQTEWLKCSVCKDDYNRLFNGICWYCRDKLREEEIKEIVSGQSYKNKTLNNFVQNDKNRQSYDKVIQFLGNDSGLYLWGLRGRGKTHLLYATCKAIKDYGKTVKFVNVPELLLEIRSTFNLQSETTEKDVVNKYCKSEYLFLDDLGVEKITDFSLQAIYLILDRREKEGKRKVFITSEKSIKEIAINLNDRIASRIIGMCGKENIVELKDKDWRIK